MQEPHIDYITSNRDKEGLVIDNKYIYNFIRKDKNNSKLYRCTYYKKNNKCKSFIKIKENKAVLEYDGNHNHEISDKSAPKARTKSLIKSEIKNKKKPFIIKGKDIYKDTIKDQGLLVPEYNTVRSSINRTINKNMSVEIKNWEDIPDNHEYYSTLSGESFMLKKNEDFIIFQSPSLAKLHIKYRDKIFCDGTFYIAPSISYQVFITRIYAEEMHYFFTTSFTIMKNKEHIIMKR